MKVQIHPQQIGFPALGEGNSGVIVGKGLGGGVFQGSRFDGPGDQIHPVRVHHGYGVNGGGFQDIPGGHAKNTAVRFRRLCQLLQKFQQHRGGNPLVGVVGGGIEHLPLSGADAQGENGSTEGGGGQAVGGKGGIPAQQLPDGLLAQFGGHGYISLHNGQKITSRKYMLSGGKRC